RADGGNGDGGNGDGGYGDNGFTAEERGNGDERGALVNGCRQPPAAAQRHESGRGPAQTRGPSAAALPAGSVRFCVQGSLTMMRVGCAPPTSVELPKSRPGIPVRPRFPVAPL